MCAAKDTRQPETASTDSWLGMQRDACAAPVAGGPQALQVLLHTSPSQLLHLRGPQAIIAEAHSVQGQQEAPQTPTYH